MRRMRSLVAFGSASWVSLVATNSASTFSLVVPATVATCTTAMSTDSPQRNENCSMRRYKLAPTNERTMSDT